MAANLIEQYSGYQKLLTLFKTKMAAAATDMESLCELRVILAGKIIPSDIILTYDNVIVVRIVYLHKYVCRYQIVRSVYLVAIAHLPLGLLACNAYSKR